MTSFDNVPANIDRRGFWQPWLKLVAGHYGSRIAMMNYTFLDDAAMLAANVRHLDHNYPTDIITFGYREGRVIEAELLIGYETIASNAKDLGYSFEDELDRVLVHGLLHLIGFDDKTPELQQKMRAAEDKCLILRAKILKEN